MVVAAVGLWRRQYWAVLGFEVILGITIAIAAVSLMVAANVLAVVVCVTVVGLGGWLFWKLVRVMGRLQVPAPRSPDGGSLGSRSHAEPHLRRRRHRLGPRRLRRRDPGGAARPEDRGGGVRRGRRPLPELRLHPGQGGPPLGRRAAGGARRRRVRHPGRRADGRLRRRDGPPREGHQDADRRRRPASSRRTASTSSRATGRSPPTATSRSAAASTGRRSRRPRGSSSPPAR